MSKISAYTSKTSPVAADELLINDVLGGANKKVTLGQLSENGTFTATLTATTPPTTPPTTTAHYTRVGKFVFLDIQFESVDTSGASGTLSITGLPSAINAAAVNLHGNAYFFNIATFTNTPMTYIAGGVIGFRENNSVTPLNIIAGTTRHLRLNVSYRIP